MISTEIFYLDKSLFLSEINFETLQMVKSIEEIYENFVLLEFQTIMTCEESRNFSFPKKPSESNSPSPMMRMVHIKLAVLKNRHLVWPRTSHFRIYLNIFLKTFKHMYHVFIKVIARLVYKIL